MRLWAIVSSDGAASKAKLFIGLPPAIMAGKDTRQEMERACFLVIEEKPDGVFLYRYGAQGGFAGDTWHLNVEDAKHQAFYEYGDSTGTWADVPEEIRDVAAFGVSQMGLAR